MVSQVDFYILRGDDHTSRLRFCCRLAEKAWKLGNRVFINTDNPQLTEQLDTLLWTWSDTSFLPHARQDDSMDAPVIIGQNPPDGFDIMINLADNIPEQAVRFPRIAEVIDDGAEVKQAGRVRFIAYRDAGHEVNHHNINGQSR